MPILESFNPTSAQHLRAPFPVSETPRSASSASPSATPVALTQSSKQAPNIITIYTDGSCRPNPGPGGWAAVIHGISKHTLQGSEQNTTNHRMELSGALYALEFIEQPSRVVVYTDATYLKNGITTWIKDWKKKGWPERIMNRDLWERLDSAVQRHIEVEFVWIRGHSGIPGNKEADRRAEEARMKQLKYEALDNPKTQLEPQNPSPSAPPPSFERPHFHNESLRSAHIQMLDGYSFEWFATLTFRNPRIDVCDAKKALNAFQSIIDNRMHGRRLVKKLGHQIRFVAVLERNYHQGVHWHLLMQGLHANCKVSSDDFPKIAKALWVKKIDGAGYYSEFENIRCMDAATVYCAKQIKRDYVEIYFDWL